MRVALAIVAAAVLVAGSAFAHDLFLKFESFFLRPNAPASVALINGTFDRSDNVITRDRMLDVRVVGPDEDDVTKPEPAQWRDVETTSWLDFETGGSGTYALGVSTAPRVIELEAKAFNDYLKHDGVTDVLDARARAGTLANDARERYSKHVKALVQVGKATSGAFDTPFGYPIEFLARQNPYRCTVGDTLDVLLLRDGEPLVDHLVYASHEGYHGHDATGAHIEAFSGRTDADGRVLVPLTELGRWYVRTIHMVEDTTDPDVDYESNWATLTFELREPEPRRAPTTRSPPWIPVVFVLVVFYLVMRRRPSGRAKDDRANA